ncbi:N-acyl homoserine lactonase family protein [Thioclava indica]|uniref:Metallo-beta-lactamase domain-containing protein n=1 Tax=Thioclava indica TaxID=1353528 RepID=A0A074JPF2_9RHOB|nr:N-acyl homoserine lactonase family protein [Thioclava indica]KEO58359.1 hypothetical protein DT23_16560 [Thioclava indica]
MSDDSHYEILAIKYAERNGRTRADSFLFDDDHAAPHPMDYYVWLVRNAHRTILVDTGYDAIEGARRGRPVLVDPMCALRDIGVGPETIDAVILTHLHYDHAGGLAGFAGAKLHMQASEMAFATGPCMCHDTLRAPFTAEHVCEAIKRVYSGLVTFHDGDAQIAPGITVHHLGGHSRGLQAVSVQTANGPVVLASDGAHYYENYQSNKLFPIVVDTDAMLRGFDRLRDLGQGGRIIPGHDPLVRQYYPRVFETTNVIAHRLDLPQTRMGETGGMK